MANTAAFYLDPGLTVPASAIAVAQATDGSTPAADRVFYIGSTAASTKFQAESSPGVDQINIRLSDANIGAGVEAAHVALAATLIGLDTATPGDPLALGTEILSGAGNAVAIYVRVDTPALATGTYNDISFVLDSVVEVPA